ncbi:hypothetical protein IHE44_0000351 [Lamprotornis superbus]|uniref:Uncharacterized protein n=1 Tax=Lamprotornis superbus TaxID=245042 RepID=A0A835P0C0_9PASS|nr:hypothetical protein IHE44_0000351 [Lamprotornis superbus]
MCGYVCLLAIQIVRFRDRSIQTTSSQYYVKNGSLQVKEMVVSKSFAQTEFDVNVIAEILTISTKDKIALSYVCITVWTPGEPYWLNDLNYQGKDRKFLFSRVIHVVFHLELSATFVSEYLGFSSGR